MPPFIGLISIATFLLNSFAFAQVGIKTPYTPPPASNGLKPSNSAPNQQWGNLLGNTLYFYDIQRAGKLPPDFRVTWRNDSVPDDGKDVGIDLSGGYFDAGNYIKASYPLCWVMTQMAWSGLTYGNGYNVAAQTPYLDRALRQGLDWIMQASSIPDELVVFIGSETTDSFYFGGDRTIPTNDRPAYKVTRSSPGTDVTAGCAAALAAGALLYNGTNLPADSSSRSDAADLVDRAYSQKLLARAISLFDMAQNSQPQQVYQNAVPQVKWAYASSDYKDRLVLGSAFLALATGQQNYSRYAQSTYSASQFPVDSGAMGWGSSAPMLPVLFVQAGLARPQLGIDVDKYRADAELYLDKLVNHKMQSTSYTNGGLIYFEGDSGDDTLVPALNAASLAVIFSRLTLSTNKRADYLKWAQYQLDYTLGKNPANLVYSIGLHPNTPMNPQSALATGSSTGLVQNIDNDPPHERYILYGAIPGGPAKDDSFSDVRSDWKETEAALDYASPMLVLAAHKLAIGETQDPFYVTLTEAPHISTPGGLSTGAKVGIAIGVILGVLLLLLCLAWLFRRRLRDYRRKREQGMHIPLKP